GSRIQDELFVHQLRSRGSGRSASDSPADLEPSPTRAPSRHLGPRSLPGATDSRVGSRERGAPPPVGSARARSSDHPPARPTHPQPPPRPQSRPHGPPSQGAPSAPRLLPA